VTSRWTLSRRITSHTEAAPCSWSNWYQRETLSPSTYGRANCSRLKNAFTNALSSSKRIGTVLAITNTSTGGLNDAETRNASIYAWLGSQTIFKRGPYTGRCSRQDLQSGKREHSPQRPQRSASRCHRPVYLLAVIAPVPREFCFALAISSSWPADECAADAPQSCWAKRRATYNPSASIDMIAEGSVDTASACSRQPA